MQLMTANFIISTDLDGTLLDHHNYSFEAALPALEQCKAQGLPVILNTSKTFSEALFLQKKLVLDAPLIVENGSAMISPDGSRLVFGVARSDIINFIKNIRHSHSWKFEGFNDWTIREIVEHTGLGNDAAKLANEKEYSEPFLWNDTATAFDEFSKLAFDSGFSILKGGRFYHLQGITDKAKPLTWLMQNHTQLFPTLKEKPRLVVLGDNANDIAMLDVADIAVCVKSPVCDFPKTMNKGEVIKTQAYGPVGWNQAVLKIIERSKLNNNN